MQNAVINIINSHTCAISSVDLIAAMILVVDYNGTAQIIRTKVQKQLSEQLNSRT
jgi:hypothetical protein